MDQRIYKYMQKSFSQRPKSIDRLIVSAFFKKNNVKLVNNKFLKEYIIDDKNYKASKKLNDFIAIIDKHFSSITIESVIELFEYVISPSDRIITGAVYTPSFVREYIVNNILDNTPEINKDWKAADIACGCGGFLYTMAKNFKKRTSFSYKQIFRNNIFGLDIKEYSITRTKILLSILAVEDGEDAEEFQFNLFTGDALRFEWSKHVFGFGGFNCIIGNPPYVCSRKLESKTKKTLSKYEVCSTGHPDLYIPFFQIGLELLMPMGYLGFITMNSFFKSLNGRALRLYLERKQYNFKIFDFGTLQVFKKRSTYTCICLIQSVHSKTIEYVRLESLDSLTKNDQPFLQIPYLNLKSHSGWNLLHSEIIQKIESVGIPFSIRFKTRNGIATLKNDIYIFKPVSENREYYYLQNGDLYPIEKSICKQIVNPNLFTNQSMINGLAEKFIFPYDFIDGKAQIFSESRLKTEFPLTYKYLASKRKILETRDKGNGEYSKWFAFGRTQSLELMKYKLFFPHITPHTPNYIINIDENLFFYNGIAVIGENIEELEVLKKLLSSRLFWFYIKNTSKPYTSGYFSLSKNYIKNFGICHFSKEEINYVLCEENKQNLDIFFEEKYDVQLSD